VENRLKSKVNNVPTDKIGLIFVNSGYTLMIVGMTVFVMNVVHRDSIAFDAFIIFMSGFIPTMIGLYMYIIDTENDCK